MEPDDTMAKAKRLMAKVRAAKLLNAFSAWKVRTTPTKAYTAPALCI